MRRRAKDQIWSRFAGPFECDKGEFRGEGVVVLDHVEGPWWLVRFPDGSTSRVHDNHLAKPFFRLPSAPTDPGQAAPAPDSVNAVPA